VATKLWPRSFSAHAETLLRLCARAQPAPDAAARIADHPRTDLDERRTVVADAADLEPLLTDAEPRRELPRLEKIVVIARLVGELAGAAI
jgi:hypothetical protein